MALLIVCLQNKDTLGLRGLFEGRNCSSSIANKYRTVSIWDVVDKQREL